MTTLLGEILEGEPLTDREAEILAAAADGDTAAETGKRLHLSSETVKGYRKRIIAKLGARNGTHAVALALRTGLLPSPRERELLRPGGTRDPATLSVSGARPRSRRAAPRP